MNEITKYAKVEGLSFIKIRNLNRIGLNTFIGKNDIKKVFGLKSTSTLKKLIDQLIKLGYIEKYDKSLDLWTNTIQGNILAHTDFIRPIKREKAQIILNGLHSRILEINNNPEEPMIINRAVISGDYLDDSLTEINEILVGIELGNRYEGKKQDRLLHAKRNTAQRIFNNIGEWAYYPDTYVRSFLKARVHNLKVIDKYHLERGMHEFNDFYIRKST